MDLQKLQMVIVITCIYMLTGNQRKSVQVHYIRLIGDRSIQQLYELQFGSSVLDLEIQIYETASVSVYTEIQMESKDYFSETRSFTEFFFFFSQKLEY